MSLRAWPLGLAVIVLSGCAGREVGKLRRASRDLVRTAEQDSSELQAHIIGSPADVERVREAWSSVGVSPARAHQLQGTLLLGEETPIDIEWTDAGWRFSEDPTNVYRQDSPRHALRTLVRATRSERWDVVAGLAPLRFRAGLSSEQLAEVWSQGQYAKVLQSARDVIAEHLRDPIRVDRDDAVLEISPVHHVILEREGQRWVIVDFLPH